MGFARPFFSGGKLVTHETITKYQAARMQEATNWASVKSSNIKYICWKPEVEGDGGKNGLGVWFKGDPEKIYYYPSADHDVFSAMLKAPSKGKFLNSVVIPNHPHLGPFSA